MKKHYIVDANLDKKYHFYNYPEHHLTFRDLYPHTAFCEYEAAHCIFFFTIMFSSLSYI